jgi:hypothetical protein
MAYNPTKTRTWRDGTTPATGTLALGSFFEAEFNQLYENWNEFFNVAGNQFSIARINVDNIYSVDGDGINFLEPIGYNIDAPVTQLQIHEGSSGSSLAHFTNTTTGATLGDGLSIGLDASENAIILNRENTDLILSTNNTPIAYVKSNGLAIGTTAVKGTRGIVHIANGTNADTNWHAYANLVIETDQAAGGINIRTPNNATGFIWWSDPDAGTGYTGAIGYDHDVNRLKFYAAGSNYMGLSSVGLRVGDSAGASNPFHIQSTTTPQQRVAYDDSNYLTVSVVSDGDTTLTTVGSGGDLKLDPAGNLYIMDGVLTRFYSSDLGEYGQIQHNGSNFVIATAGTSAGDIVISNTTESTTKDTGALIVEGGVGVEKNLYVGGNLSITGNYLGNVNLSTGYITTAKGRWPTGSIEGSAITENTIFDTLSPYISSTDNEMIISGGYSDGSPALMWTFNRAKRINATQIYLYGVWINHTAGTTGDGYYTIDDGSGSTLSHFSISW